MLFLLEWDCPDYDLNDASVILYGPFDTEESAQEFAMNACHLRLADADLGPDDGWEVERRQDEGQNRVGCFDEDGSSDYWFTFITPVNPANGIVEKM